MCHREIHIFSAEYDEKGNGKQLNKTYFPFPPLFRNIMVPRTILELCNVGYIVEITILHFGLYDLNISDKIL